MSRVLFRLQRPFCVALRLKNRSGSSPRRPGRPHPCAVILPTTFGGPLECCLKYLTSAALLHDPASTRQQATNRIAEIGFDGFVGARKPFKPEAGPRVEVELVALKVEVYVEVKGRLLRNFQLNSLGVKPHAEMREFRAQGLEQCNGSSAPWFVQRYRCRMPAGWDAGSGGEVEGVLSCSKNWALPLPKIDPQTVGGGSGFQGANTTSLSQIRLNRPQALVT